MKIVKLLAAAVLTLVPTMIVTEPAQALTARQYQHQGRGQYVTSKGNRPSRAIYHHRHNRPHHYRR